MAIANGAAAAIPPRKILQAIRKDHPDLRLTRKDVANLVGTARLTELNGRSPINALVDELVKNRIFHRVETDDQMQVTHLFYAFPDGILLLRRYGAVVLLDSTYKTNIFRMPMLHGVGTTCTHQTFSAFVCFMRRERAEDYQWTLKCLRSIFEANDVAPRVFVTDREQALMNALETEFPLAHNMLCIWHINQNIAAKFKASFSREQWTTWMKRWNELIRMATASEFDDALQGLLQNSIYATPVAMRQYLEATWLPLRCRFVRPWTKQYRHLDHTVTSRVEAAHARIKKYVEVSTGDLYFASKQILDGHKEEIERVTCTIARQRQRDNPLLAGEIYRQVRQKISWHALKKVSDQSRQARAAIADPVRNSIGACTSEPPAPREVQGLTSADEHWTVLGLPCRHVMAGLVRDSLPLRISHFADLWQLHSIDGQGVVQPEQETLPALTARVAEIAGSSDAHRAEAARQLLQGIVDGEERLLQQPAMVTNPRGRPRGALGRRRRAEPESSTRRDASLHEIMEEAAAGPNRRRCGQCGGQGHNRRTCPARQCEAQLMLEQDALGEQGTQRATDPAQGMQLMETGVVAVDGFVVGEVTVPADGDEVV
jgi:hypothetical protein